MSSTVERKKILIVDDMPNNLSLVTHLLKPFYEVLLANDGQKAITVAHDHHPDLILLDIMMPGMNGYDACARLKESKTTEDIPVIFLTAKASGDDIQKAYEVGGVDYIIKPVNPKELLARVKNHLAIIDHQRKIDLLNQELLVIDGHKNKIFSILSHDLTNAISGSHQLLNILMTKVEAGSLSQGDLLKRLTAVRNGMANTELLLKDILLWSKNQVKKVVFAPKEFEVRQRIEEIMRQLEVQKQNKQINFHLAVEDTLKVHADIDMFSVIVRNLLSNAIKFSKPGGPIEVSAARQDNHIEIRVADQGVGIPPQDIDRIFSFSSNVTTPGTAGEKGNGLGLGLCRELVKKHEGTIRAESEPGKGATIIVTFPFPVE